MSIFKFLVLGATFYSLSSSFSFADESAPSNSSGGMTANRENKTWGLVGQGGDFYFGGQSTFGIGVAGLFYIDAKSILSVELGVGGNFDFWSSVGGDTVNGSNSRIGVYYKRFVTNSFYLKGGLEERSIHYNVVHYPISGSDYSQSADIDLYAAWLGIGHQWDIKGHLIIGCDWVGVSVPFANTGFRESDSGPSYTPWNLKSRLTSLSVNVARFYIGGSF